MDNIWQLLGIKKSYSFRLHPQDDRLSESFAKIMKNIIQKQVYLNNWDNHLHAAYLAIRSNISSSIQMTPAESILGCKLHHPLNQVITTQPTTSYNQKQGYEIAIELAEKLQAP